MFNTDSLLALRRVQRMDMSAGNELIAEVGRVADDEAKFITDLYKTMPARRRPPRRLHPPA